jgi:hypothetical protein
VNARLETFACGRIARMGGTESTVGFAYVRVVERCSENG